MKINDNKIYLRDDRGTYSFFIFRITDHPIGWWPKTSMLIRKNGVEVWLGGVV